MDDSARLSFYKETLFALCIMGFSRFWLNMADKKIKVHRRVIRVIFPMIQRAENDRSVLRALPVYDNGQQSSRFLQQKCISAVPIFLSILHSLFLTMMAGVGVAHKLLKKKKKKTRKR